MRLRLLSCALVACGAVLTAGCGGGNGGSAVGTTSNTSTTRTTSSQEAVTRPTDEWVAGYCSDALELFVFLVDSRDGTLGGFVTPHDAGRILTFRAGRFVDQMNQLRRPDTPDGDKGESTIRDLAAHEKASADRIVKGTAGNPPKGTLAERRQLVHDEVNGSLKAITDTTTKLGNDDAEVAKAIEAAEDCVSLAGDMRKHYPSSKG